MDSELSTPQFTVGQENASFLASCRILDQSWKEIHSVYTQNIETFLLNIDEGVAYVTFSSLYMEDFMIRDGRCEECNIQNENTVLFPSLKGDDEKPALVHKGAFNRFLYILEDLKTQVQSFQGQVIVFVGHSMGGAVATLASLWFLEKRMKNTSAFCITFGSPLVGDARLGEAIAHQDWSGRFYHVVCQHDIVPRMLLAPLELIAVPLNTLVPHWKSVMGIDSVAGPDLPIQEASRTLLNNVLQCTDSPTSPYRPCGTYMFCSKIGAACIDEPEAVLKMLHYTMQSKQGLSFDQIAGACILEHTDYGHMLEVITEELLNASQIADFVSDDSFEMGIALELEAIGIGAQNKSAFNALKKAKELKNKHDMDIVNLNAELSENQSKMAELEWYIKKVSEGNDRGSYDVFREQSERRDFHANHNRISLEIFWDDIIEKVKNHVLPSSFRFENKWINAGTAYRRLVEPLDIADHYRRQSNSGSYLSIENRPNRHIVLEKWLKDKDQTRIDRGKGDKKPRTKFASLTEDSCFWARVEEALKTLQHQVMNAPQTESLENFECDVWKMIEDRSISDEVFLEGSSFIRWWQQYRDLRRQSQQWQSNSPLFNFMNTEGWKAVGI